jgi:P-type Ca2+ transporter type 2C
MKGNEMLWHTMEAEAVLVQLNTSSAGLTEEEARTRLEQHGPNELTEGQGVSPLKIFFDQFKSILIIILLVAVGLSVILGESVDAIVIGAILLFAIGLGFIQEYRAERAMEALKRMAAPTATVIRRGKEQEIDARELVPGDIIVLSTGDRIPADARILEAVNLKADEAPLTGESVPVEKTSVGLGDDVEVAERKNMVFMGTAVVYGRGVGVVTATGMKSEFGKIAQMLQAVEVARTPLQKNLDRMGKWIAIAGLLLCFLLGVIGVLRGHQVIEMLIWGISLAVAAVPEALPAVVTIGLAIGVQRMVKRHALVRRLPVVETLGCTTVICSDKTGTLTQDQMTVRRLWVADKSIDVSGVGYEPQGAFSLEGGQYEPIKDKDMEMLLLAGALCNDTHLTHSEGGWEIKGDPTEGALVVLAQKAGLEQGKLVQEYPRIGEIPFSSERKRMTTIHRSPDNQIAFMKGAPEVVLDASAYISRGGREEPLTLEERERMLDFARAMAGDALRVLGFAYRRLPDKEGWDESVEEGMVFVGLAGMIDPPREEVKEAIKTCERAGLKTVMITGDHQVTAEAIAAELDIMRGGQIVSGHQLEQLSQRKLDSIVEGVDVYARVSPAHKLKIVTALQAKKHVVAMTGDGVNDAPALKQADIGIAMGITGTDVTKEAADMVLTDDNFSSIVAAVEEGRGIYGNIKKYLVYLLSCNLGEILLMAVAILFGPFFGLPAGIIPLLAIHILYVNLATDGLPAIALSLDPPETGIMEVPPRPRDETIFTPGVLRYLMGAGMWTAFVSLAIFVWAIHAGRGAVGARALCFVTLILIQFFNAFNCRSEQRSLFQIGVFANRWLWLAILWECVILILVLYIPVLQGAFRVFPLAVGDWLIVIFSASTIFMVAEAYKLINRSRRG